MLQAAALVPAAKAVQSLDPAPRTIGDLSTTTKTKRLAACRKGLAAEARLPF
jgi:hypothetical protein